MLDEALLDDLIGRYKGLITCVAFMGGDAEPMNVIRLANYIHELRIKNEELRLKTAWYSGRTNMPQDEKAFDYVKLGPYIEALGGLKSEKTNQRLYKRVGDEWEDITNSFWKKNL